MKQRLQESLLKAQVMAQPITSRARRLRVFSRQFGLKLGKTSRRSQPPQVTSSVGKNPSSQHRRKPKTPDFEKILQQSRIYALTADGEGHSLYTIDSDDPRSVFRERFEACSISHVSVDSFYALRAISPDLSSDLSKLSKSDGSARPQKQEEPEVEAFDPLTELLRLREKAHVTAGVLPSQVPRAGSQLQDIDDTTSISSDEVREEEAWGSILDTVYEEDWLAPGPDQNYIHDRFNQEPTTPRVLEYNPSRILVPLPSERGLELCQQDKDGKPRFSTDAEHVAISHTPPTKIAPPITLSKLDVATIRSMPHPSAPKELSAELPGTEVDGLSVRDSLGGL